MTELYTMSADLAAKFAKLSGPAKQRCHRIADLLEVEEDDLELDQMSERLGFSVVAKEYRVAFAIWRSRRSWRRRSVEKAAAKVAARGTRW